MCDVRTFLVFLDAPKHVEFRVDGWPLLEEGTVVDLEIDLKEPGERKVREVRGPYVVRRRSLRFSTQRASRTGFSQYLEIEPEARGPS